MQINLTGRVAIVTGASSGLGLAIAGALKASGAIVVRTGRGASDAADWQTVDVRDADAVERLVQGVAQQYGRLDIMVNNAGISATDGSSVEKSLESWNDIVRTNLDGTWFGCRAAIRQMLRDNRSGTIINMSSRMALSAGSPGRAAYAASKAGISNLTRQLAVEYGRQGIRINAVLPGFVPYTSGATNNDPARIQLALQQTPTTRLGLPADIANAVLFLASDAAGYVNGHNLVVDGGASVRP
ncbi:SDR family oxidoreductase [Devosia sp. 2618]|uniref:SDR family NAD(P)-dependent oxidoreductase n=1 Tax=Devosia sp. 2618 TaxID=3156454 RepID=UPI003399C1B5